MSQQVIVTGGGQGIGRQIALTLAARHFAVCIADNNREKGHEVAAEIEKQGGRSIFVYCDVSSSADCRRVVAETVVAFGGVSGVVNNAAIFSTLTMRPFWEIPEDEWNAVLNVNLTGVWQLTRAAVPKLRDAQDSSIVNMSSSTVMMGRQNYAHYVASKAGVIGLSRAMARELGEFGIRVNAITPGPIMTEVPRASVTPQQREQLVAAQSLKRAGQPDDIASVVAFLLSSDSKFISGQTINVDGGMMHL
jgi:NAD(P)-dependent dehydrogenase (short-subunit alcohol dehydrogenase family)